MSICNNLCEHINNFSLRINYKTVRKKEKKGQPIPIFVATIRYMIQDVFVASIGLSADITMATEERNPVSAIM